MTEHELINYGVSVGWLTPEKAEVLKKLLEPKWIPVSEALPKSMANKVLVYLDHEDLAGYIGFGHYEKFQGEEMWYDLEHNEQFSKRGYTVTHWMQLPEPPRVETHCIFCDTAYMVEIGAATDYVCEKCIDTFRKEAERGNQ